MHKRHQFDEKEGVPESELKRKKVEDEDEISTELVAVSSSSALVVSGATPLAPNRTSRLLAPTMLLEGHSGPVYSLAFSPDGENLASGSLDSNILLWNVYGACANYNVLSGHKSGVLELKWTSENKVVSCSADKTVALWDANKGQRLRRLTEHAAIVNSCSIARDTPHLFASGSDDCTAILWDTRCKPSLSTVYHDYQVLATALAHDGQTLFTGGLDNIIRRWDLRNLSEAVEDLKLQGASDSISGLSVSPDGHYLLSNSLDQAVRSWDVRPFVADPSARCEKMFVGAAHGTEKNLLRCSWSPSQLKVACGSSDRNVYIWDVSSCRLEYILPGHKGSVNEVIFHPKEPIVASSSTDGVIFLGELC